MKQVTAAVRDELVAGYESGLGVYELARKHGLHRYTVAQHLTTAGVVMRRTITDDEKTKARALYLSSASFAEIGRQLKRDPATVKKMGLPHG
ncbi:helix-turn-helix domain-containing protein [Microbacterium sp.]|uniref:helix-turn-helix domain-containing protein n=1 Tax=Microbacterium sp. TaxID=51671 RepID=UPI0039E5E4A5